MATTPHTLLMGRLEGTPEAAPILARIMDYLHTYGHQGYSLDFVEPTQVGLTLSFTSTCVVIHL